MGERRKGALAAKAEEKEEKTGRRSKRTPGTGAA